MKTNLRFLASIALAATGAALASAQYSSAYGYGYASGTLYNYSGSGMYVTGASAGTYAFYTYGPYSYGNSGYSDGYGGQAGNPAYAVIAGDGYSNAQPGGSFEVAEAEASNWVTITNTSSAPQYEFLQAYTYGFASAYSSSWNAYAEGIGEGFVYDSGGMVDQFSEAEAYDLGLGIGGDGWAYYDYANGNSAYGSAFYGNQFPFGTNAYGDYSVYYTMIFQPGQSDTFYFGGAEAHETYAVTPGPGAVAPFALGLIGVLRRRKKA